MSPADPAHTGPVSTDPARENKYDREYELEHPEDPDLAEAPTPDAVDPATQQALESRYGSGRRRSFDRRVAYGIAGALVAAAVAFFAFSGWQNGQQVSWQDIGYRAESDQVLNVKFEVTAAAGTTVACAVEGINASKATVGWKVLEIPASNQLTHTVTTKLIVTNPAVAVTTRECWTIS